MTTIIFKKTLDGNYKGFECKGHAGFDDYGSDIVCASISMLVINTINSFEALLKIVPMTESDEKKGIIKCTFQAPLDEKGKLLMDSLVLGCTGISEEYGKKFCKVKFEEV